jgi:hypothetical protein
MRQAYQRAAIGRTDPIRISSHVGMKVPRPTVRGGMVTLAGVPVATAAVVASLLDAVVGAAALLVDGADAVEAGATLDAAGVAADTPVALWLGVAANPGVASPTEVDAEVGVEVCVDFVDLVDFAGVADAVALDVVAFGFVPLVVVLDLVDVVAFVVAVAAWIGIWATTWAAGAGVDAS